MHHDSRLRRGKRDATAVIDRLQISTRTLKAPVARRTKQQIWVAQAKISTFIKKSPGYQLCTLAKSRFARHNPAM
jgi:hypothetical protein